MDPLEGLVGEELPFYAPEAFKRVQAQGKTELAELLPRVPSLEIVVPADVRELEVLVDDKAVDASKLRTPIFVDPGEHRVVARGDGVPDTLQKVTVAEGEKKRVEFDIHSPKVAAPAPDPKPDPPPDAPEAPQPQPSLAPAIVAFGIGAVGLGVGGVTGALALGKANKVKATCDPGCDRATIPDYESAKSLGTISTVGFIVGGVGVATGVVLVLARPKAAPSKAASLSVSIAPSAVRLLGSF